MIEEFAVPLWVRLMARMTGRHLRRATGWPRRPAEPAPAARPVGAARSAAADHHTLAAAMATVPTAGAEAEAGAETTSSPATVSPGPLAASAAAVSTVSPADVGGPAGETAGEGRLTRSLLTAARAMDWRTRALVAASVAPAGSDPVGAGPASLASVPPEPPPAGPEPAGPEPAVPEPAVPHGLDGPDGAAVAPRARPGPAVASIPASSADAGTPDAGPPVAGPGEVAASDAPVTVPAESSRGADPVLTVEHVIVSAVAPPAAAHATAAVAVAGLAFEAAAVSTTVAATASAAAVDGSAGERGSPSPADAALAKEGSAADGSVGGESDGTTALGTAALAAGPPGSGEQVTPSGEGMSAAAVAAYTDGATAGPPAVETSPAEPDPEAADAADAAEVGVGGAGLGGAIETPAEAEGRVAPPSDEAEPLRPAAARVEAAAEPMPVRPFVDPEGSPPEMGPPATVPVAAAGSEEANLGEASFGGAASGDADAESTTGPVDGSASTAVAPAAGPAADVDTVPTGSGTDAAADGNQGADKAGTGVVDGEGDVAAAGVAPPSADVDPAAAVAGAASEPASVAIGVAADAVPEVIGATEAAAPAAVGLDPPAREATAPAAAAGEDGSVGQAAPPPPPPVTAQPPAPASPPATAAAQAAQRNAASVLAPAVRDEFNRTGLDYRRPMPRPKVRGLVVDFHCHLFALRHAADWFEAADHYGMDVFLTMSPLEEAVGLAREWGHRLRFNAVPAWGDASPQWVGNWLTRIEAFYNLGSRIAKFHASPGTMAMRGLRLDAPQYQPIFAELKARKMGIMTHIGDPDTWYHGRYDPAKFGSRDEHYRMWEGLLEEHRGTPWVGAHLGGNPEDPPRLQRLLDKFPDLMLDCSATRWMVREVSARREPMREFFIRNQDRILFGSDQVSGHDRHFDFLASRIWCHRKLWETAYTGPSPIIDPDVSRDAQPVVRGLALPDVVLQKIYHDNATRLLGKLGMGFEG